MDFTKKLQTEAGEVYKAPETYKDDKGINATREIEVDFLRIAQESLLNQLPTTEDNIPYNTYEALDSRFDLCQKINESPDNVELSEDEKALILDLAKLKFGNNVTIISRLFKELK